MKKILSLVLAFALVLSVASVAFAGAWDADTSSDTKEFGITLTATKYAVQSGLYSFSYISSGGAAAVNSAPVYYSVKLVIAGNVEADVLAAAEATVTLNGIAGTSISKDSIATLTPGTYYYDGEGGWTAATDIILPTDVALPVVQAMAYDASDASVTAKVTSKGDITDLDGETWGDYTVTYDDDAKTLVIEEGSDKITFKLKGSKNIASIDGDNSSAAPGWFEDVYKALGISAADLAAGKVSFSKDNLVKFFYFSYTTGDKKVVWGASSNPIIVDPNAIVNIPKTGDNTSVVGFAMVMVALVAAAVAVKKVKA